MASALLDWFRPTYDAIFSTLPFTYRWRLLAFQPLVLLIYSMKTLPWLFSTAYTVHRIPTRAGGTRRVIVFQPSRRTAALCPLHLVIHGGGFIGGIAEMNADFAQLVAERTGAVVVCASYRHAPRHAFPAAIDDVDDVIAWLFANAEEMFGADPKLFTVSGFSAGGNLALAASQQRACQLPSPTNIKASVTFYAPVDLRPPPWEKPKPPNYPRFDPISWILPLADAYAGHEREANLHNPRVHPILADVKTLPEDMLFVIPTIDILLYEQLILVERPKREIADSPEQREGRVESVIFDGQMHAWLELPSFAIDEKTRTKAYDAAIEFLQTAHRKYGCEWDAQ